jgi:hypothetical protein
VLNFLVKVKVKFVKFCVKVKFYASQLCIRKKIYKKSLSFGAEKVKFFIRGTGYF